MLLIGIITDKNDENELNTKLKEIMKKDFKKVEIISINQKSIENVKNIKFNVIIINSRNSIFKCKETLNKIFGSAQCLLVNSDICEILTAVCNTETTVISYGFNSRATITASSVSDEEILICIQREFENLDGKKVELQEIIFENITKNEYISLAIASVCVFCGINM